MLSMRTLTEYKQIAFWEFSALPFTEYKALQLVMEHSIPHQQGYSSTEPPSPSCRGTQVFCKSRHTTSHLVIHDWFNIQTFQMD